MRGNENCTENAHTYAKKTVLKHAERQQKKRRKISAFYFLQSGGNELCHKLGKFRGVVHRQTFDDSCLLVQHL